MLIIRDHNTVYLHGLTHITALYIRYTRPQKVHIIINSPMDIQHGAFIRMDLQFIRFFIHCNPKFDDEVKRRICAGWAFKEKRIKIIHDKTWDFKCNHWSFHVHDYGKITGTRTNSKGTFTKTIG